MVVAPTGEPLSGVSVFVHEDGGADYNVCTAPKSTDEDGKAVFSLEVGKLYSVSVIGFAPIYTAKPGKTREDRYVIEGTETLVRLGANENYVPPRFRLGDTMVNFTLTDIDGNEYELYDLLETKKAVILNFWLYGCGPCRMEFPSLNSAYNNYKDDIEVLAINDHPDESLGHVKSYEADAGLTLDMPLFRGQYGSRVSISRFGTDGYPTTVVIDRNGKICFIHAGAVTSTSKWNKLFAIFTADDYTTTIIDNINEVT
jgi:thiol-disulfide isomerase/thioredoxin